MGMVTKILIRSVAKYKKALKKTVFLLIFLKKKEGR
jgi:hypothetical protein